MKILAIDPGTRRTGWAVFTLDGRSPRLADHGSLTVRGRDLPGRLLYLYRAVERLLRRHRPGHVAVERPFVGRSASDALTLGAARAVCLLAAAAGRARVFDYAPAQVKKAVSGNGRASKGDVQRMVRLLIGAREAPPPDAADAIALALCHINRL